MLIKRQLPLPTDYSFFLFGPRNTGKSTLLEQTYTGGYVLTISLLNTEILSILEKNPHRLVGMIEAIPHLAWVVIDEIQYVPGLLNEVHFLMEKHPTIKFALTGSSARKLKRGQANLLAGRAFSFFLHPLTYSELGDRFELQSILEYGSLPKLFSLQTDSSKQRFLKSYAETYLKEEIQAEGAIRNLKGFKHFLEIAARENGNCLNFSNIASDVGIDAKTVKSYFQILEDTLLGFLLPAYHRSLRQRQKTHPKFYFFDIGVTRALSGTLAGSLHPESTEYGRVFEQFVILEIIRANDYLEKGYRFSYLASPSMEVDLVIERPGKETLFLEIKSRRDIMPKHVQTLENIIKNTPNSKGICVCQEPVKRVLNDMVICPFTELISEVFS